MVREAGGLPSNIWQNDFTVDNLIDYARAARTLSEHVGALRDDGYGHLVIPSRGAVPLIDAAAAAWKLDARSLPTYTQRRRGASELSASPFDQPLVLPFSADPQDATQTTAAIRRYWSRVLAAVVRRDGCDPHLASYRVVVEKLAGRAWSTAMPSSLPDGKFILVDTVVSGRAICEMFNAFDEAGLRRCHFVLIVDARGAEVGPQYQRVIEEMAARRRCTLIPVNRLFTEDRGPAVSGVWSTVYPQVIDALRNRFEWARDAYGAGTFYHRVPVPRLGPFLGAGAAGHGAPVPRTLASLSVGVYTAISALRESELVEQRLAKAVNRGFEGFADIVAERQAGIDLNLRRQLEFQLMTFRDSVSDMNPYSPLNRATTRALTAPGVLEAHPHATIDVSSSHLVRVTLPGAQVDQVMSEVENRLARREDALLGEWYRRLRAGRRRRAPT